MKEQLDLKVNQKIKVRSKLGGYGISVFSAMIAEVTGGSFGCQKRLAKRYLTVLAPRFGFLLTLLVLIFYGGVCGMATARDRKRAVIDGSKLGRIIDKKV